MQAYKNRSVQIIKEDIIARINKGDAKAFEQLYIAFYVYLCAVATKYIYHAEAAQEIVNDVFLNVWNNRKSLTYPVNAYLVRSIQNRCLNYLRQQHLQEIPLSDIQESLLNIQEHQVEGEAHPLAKLENKEFEEKILSAVNQLPEKCRDIFVQYLYYNKSYDEIAKENNIATSTVRVQIKIGLSKLKDILGDIYPAFLLIYDFFQK
ncbi:RNA polymerase sigma-70 factor, ECF subfamily [Parabacteroides chinchillae]|uniref:RNA polymerase sigma-70 factor, ECF subfamily n=1 Tax=Parabacteroides chinchillae TaxID=871327 RepID=A0A8G2F5E5_9BACT|nr:RNA polymerase sigma-70 factor, ECF subfamily [Parabacteroides chinchillae]